MTSLITSSVTNNKSGVTYKIFNKDGHEFNSYNNAGELVSKLNSFSTAVISIDYYEKNINIAIVINKSCNNGYSLTETKSITDKKNIKIVGKRHHSFATQHEVETYLSQQYKTQIYIDYSHYIKAKYNGTEVYRQLKEFISTYDYVSLVRIADRDNRQEVNIFDDIENSYDEYNHVNKFINVGDKEYIIGFSYSEET